MSRIIKLKNGKQFIGIIDVNNVEIYEGDYIDFYTPKITHGPDREDYERQLVWYSSEDACYYFGTHSFQANEVKGIKVVEPPSHHNN